MSYIQTNPDLVAACGLYCGACKAYLHAKCSGCRENAKATWCKVRACCSDKRITTCADCIEFENARDCPKFNNVVSKIFGFVFRSDRAACIEQIRHLGVEGHARTMAERGVHTLKRA